MLRRGVLSRALDHFQLHGESKIACFCGQKALLYSAIVTKREIEPDMSKSITLGPLGECRMETPLKSRTYVSDDTRVLVDATTGPDGVNPNARIGRSPPLHSLRSDRGRCRHCDLWRFVPRPQRCHPRADDGPA